MPPFPRAAIALILAIPLAYGLWRTERLAQADWLAQEDTVAALQAASRIEPSNAAYYKRITVLDPARREDLDAALRLNPRDPSLWDTLAGRQEQDGDPAGAEKSLLQADSVCQYYTPRWMTAYFYFRRGKRAEFTKWARNAMSVGAGETQSIFQMAKQMGMSSKEIASQVVPDDPLKVVALINFLFDNHEPAETYEPAAKLVGLGAKNQRWQVLRVCDSLFESGNFAGAVALWNQMVKAGWVPFGELDPRAGKVLARTNFSGEKIEHGFDWTYWLPQGVSASTGETEGSLRLEFSGNEPTDFDLVSMLVPLSPGQKYRLAVKYRLNGVKPDCGLAWSIATISDGKPVATAAFGKGTEASVDFEAQKKPARLLMTYNKSLGTTRIEGTVWIESVKLEPVP
jgi:pentatricopeptide repeat protein